MRRDLLATRQEDSMEPSPAEGCGLYDKPDLQTLHITLVEEKPATRLAIRTGCKNYPHNCGIIIGKAEVYGKSVVVWVNVEVDQ